MLKFFHQRAPYAVTGLVLLLLLTFAKVVNGNCSEKRFLYKLPHSENCGMCRICSEDVLVNPKQNQRHIQEKCLDNKPLQDGRLAHCHSHNFDLPSCEKLAPQIGTLHCTNTNIVYSSCHLVCPQGHSTSRSGNITCTSSLNWNNPLPVCVAGRRLENPKILNGAAIACIVLAFPVTIGIIIIVLIKRKCNRYPCQNDIEYGQTSDHRPSLVSLMLTHGHLVDIQKQKWTVQSGGMLKIEAKCQSSKVLYLVLLKRGFKNRKVYTNKQDEPGQIILHNIRRRHSGNYDWIVGLENGTKEEGSFIIKVSKFEKQIKEPISSSSDEKTSLTDIDDEVSDEDTDMATACEDIVVPKTAVTENNLEKTDTDLPQSRCSGSGFARLMKSRSDVNKLCTLFDREHKDGQISWHNLALSDMLGFDKDFVIFLEYHLKGKLYQGPMWYVLTLMRQRGVTLHCFVEYLEDHQPGSNTAVELLKQYINDDYNDDYN